MTHKISVILPNYNYEKFIPQRLSSILNQTCKPSEIIFLDDCSQDNSVGVAKDLLKDSGIPHKIITNTENKGVFNQWLKGIELATNDLVWIAETDDYAQLDFIEKMTVFFDDEKVVLAYCRSEFVNSDGEIITEEKEEKKKFFTKTERWDSQFICSGLEEIQNHLSVNNTIPNASAVIVNKKRLNRDKLQVLHDYRKAGDWLFYILALQSFQDNKIAYTPDKLNNYVRHEKSVMQSNHKNPVLFKEVLSIVLYIYDNFSIQESNKRLMFKNLFVWLEWFDLNDELKSYLLKILHHFSPDEILLATQQILRMKEDEINGFQARIASLAVETAAMDEKIAALTAQINALHNSTSWKLTGPLRKIISLFRNT
ncbi:glycosyltransferase family 2 protein [uncultured Desulfobacter sp.]|uniref:glycosyltransferase family 2 protein n=1 Tax=uncultured Desulfobacter sp. TaxID=240139 RepID=UPI002AAA6467|nr:glycosyltransferase family 2 protein [uncultured Desulfobacter sp.]